jgi:fructosamine-3-kinase
VARLFFLKELFAHIASGMDEPLAAAKQVSGGDINMAYAWHTASAKYFLKVNDADAFPNMFALEAEGLEALREASSICVPQVLKAGRYGRHQYLLLSWIEAGKPAPDAMEKFGTALALMHQQPQQAFGWHSDNYIGSLKQRNAWQDNWSSFYGSQRIMPLIHMLYGGGLVGTHHVEQSEHFCRRLDQLFPQESPSLLHGDLWSGNYMIADNGYACFYDPAVYCGHREMDIGMTKLFGGFDQKFYSAYNEAYPLQPGWQQRLPIAQLHPLLVHAVLFGGHYVQQALGIIQQFS